MELLEPSLTRRALLASMGCAGLAACATAAHAAEGEITVEKLIQETTRQPRAMRDAALPFYGDPLSSSNLPDNSYDYCVASAARSSDFAARATRMRAGRVAPPDAETLDILIWDLDRDVALAPYYWHEFPLGYSSTQIGTLRQMLGTAPAAEARQQYLSRLRQAPWFVDNIRLRLLGQLERGLTPPRSEAERALSALHKARGDIMSLLTTIAGKGSDTAPPNHRFEAEVLALVRGPLAASLDALSETLKHRYLPELDESSAVARAEDAKAYHRELIGLRVSGELDPVEEHRAATESLAEIDQELALMRRALGSSADASAFHIALARDPRWIARDAEEVATRLNRAASAIAPFLQQFFSDLPKTPCRVAPLPDTLSQVLLNGYYQGPTKADPRGTYFFNPSGLNVTTWAWETSLISHELMPGHHLHFARLFEAVHLSPYRKSFYLSGYGEGWGDYARRLMEEGGLYADDPWGLYASRLLDRRFALRTVVETGIHLPGWTWQEADRTLASDPLTRPGTTRQLALAAATFRTNGIVYWKGLRRFMEMRRLAEARNGPAFDIRKFHNLIMQGDSVPFNVLERRLRSTSFASCRPAPAPAVM